MPLKRTKWKSLTRYEVIWIFCMNSFVDPRNSNSLIFLKILSTLGRLRPEEAISTKVFAFIRQRPFQEVRSWIITFDLWSHDGQTFTVKMIIHELYYLCFKSVLLFLLVCVVDSIISALGTSAYDMVCWGSSQHSVCLQDFLF